MMQRRYFKAPRNIGFAARVSARALNVAGTSLRDFFHQPGIRPQRIGTISRPTISQFLMREVTTSINAVGAMLKRGCRLDEFDHDDSSEDGVVTYTFERLDKTGPARWVVSTLHRRDFPRHFRALEAKFPVKVVGVDPRPSNHPARRAEED